MGTRGLVGLIIAAKRHGAYNHFDSYPAGLGRDIVKFIVNMKPEEWDEMARLLKEVTWVDESSEPSKELQELYSGHGYHEPNLNGGSTHDWCNLLRGIQGVATLEAIKSGNLKHVAEAVSFQENTIFCEWAYFVDFEKRVLETWDRELLDTISFEDLMDLGATKYMERVEKAHQGDDEE